MVATASPSSSKSLPLSYADRAKNVKISTQPAQSLPNGNTSTSNNSTSPSKVADKATDSSPIVEHPGPSIDQTQSLHSPSSPSRSTRTHPSALNKVDNPSSVSNFNPASSVKPVSPVNVWDLRKEQMAQASLRSRASSNSNAQNHSHANSTLDPKLVANPHSSHSSDILLQDFSENDDPFVVRSRVPISAPADDFESWPEVGNSTRSVSSHSGAGSRKDNEKSEQNDSRKGEKHKWVQIPTSELQAAADAQRIRTQVDLSNQSQYKHNPQAVSTGGSSTGSFITSPRSSRPQSWYASTSHSRVHSRPESIQTSPRQPARSRLPTDSDISDATVSGTSESSRAYSPAPPVVQSQVSYDHDPGDDHRNLDSIGLPSQNLPQLSANGHASKSTNKSLRLVSNHHSEPATQSDWIRSTSLHLDRNKGIPPESLRLQADKLPIFISSELQHANASDASGESSEVSSALSSGYAVDHQQDGHGRHIVFGQFEGSQLSRPTTPDAQNNGSSDPPENHTRLVGFSIGVGTDELFSRQRWKTTSRVRRKGDDLSRMIVANGGYTEPPTRSLDLEEEPRWTFGTTGGDDAGALSQGDVSAYLSQHSSQAPVFDDLTAPQRPDLLDGGDEFEVRDFGYGFGSMSGTGRAPAVVREERLARERQRDQERQRERERERGVAPELERERESPLDSDPREKDREFGRPKRGMFAAHDRGNNHPRRGRGNTGFGRGYGPRTFIRGYQGYPRQQHLIDTPPSHQHSLSLHGYSPEPGTSAFYPAPPNYGLYGVGYDVYSYASYPQTTAFAVPQSTVSFPLDPTRYYLLGQLEYYLSPQNMAQDFYLRQKMDSQGWIPIQLLASFNRVRQLTMDIQLVRQVLALSKIVEISGDWVRMSGQQWKQFILPTNGTPSDNAQTDGHPEESLHGEDDDEDDVEFVMG